MCHLQSLLSGLKMGAEREERPQQVSCYRAGDEKEGKVCAWRRIGLGGEEGELRSEDYLPTSLAGLAREFPGNDCGIGA